jgi:hypothetical protein
MERENLKEYQKGNQQVGESEEDQGKWIEDIEEDNQLMGIRGWKKLSKERMEENH